MENVIFSRVDHSVTGRNRPTLPGEYSVQLPYPIILTKVEKRYLGEKQKTTEGQLLYKDNVEVSEAGQETFDEVTEARKATAWEEVTQEYRLVNEDGTTTPVTNTAQVPTEWEELAPVMVPDEVDVNVDFQDAPQKFTYEELIDAKKASFLANQERQLVFYDEDYPVENFCSQLTSHAANMGDGIMALHPGGCCRTVKLPLGKTTDTIQLYLEAQPDVRIEVGATVDSFVEVIEGFAQLPEAADEIYILFKNMTDRYRNVYAFGILA